MQHGESAFQIAVVRFLRSLGYQVFSVPNGTRLKPSQARIAKAEGLTAGVSDLVIMLPKGQIVFVELKNPNGKGRQSDGQKEFERVCRSLGFEYKIWQSWEDVESFTNRTAQLMREWRAGNEDTVHQNIHG